ncbi:hypothetical protein M3Y98_00053700 [Aphelenchoides besseyi]|nr:hypothetical protein M3Y98_00053700 [Aphelenchoides besseyi]
MLTSKTVALLSLMAFLLPILGLAITAEDERMIYKNPSAKRFYDWDSVQPTPATPRKRFYSWNYSQGAVPPQPEITPKERQFLKEFLQQK